jgi:lysophospholipase
MLADSPRPDPRGTIILFPGRTEFIEKYLESVEDFLNRGFTVLVMDPRGQGLSDRLLPDGLKSYVRDFQDYADDLAFVIDELKPHLPKPHILMGHSMGGCVVLQAIISGIVNPSAVIACAPMLGLFDVEPGVMVNILKAANILGFSKRNLPFQKQGGGLPVPFKGNKLTSDEDRFRKWAAYFETTPDLRVGPPTVAWVAAGLRAMSYVNRNADKLGVPGLIVAAGGDPIVTPSSNQIFAAAAGVDFHVVPAALHELFLEKDQYRDEFFRVIDGFLDKQAL